MAVRAAHSHSERGSAAFLVDQRRGGPATANPIPDIPDRLRRIEVFGKRQASSATEMYEMLAT
jgi:hypothetical protein